jgi:dihydrofolate reductase
MARLTYSAIMSVDGYTADADGNFDWAAPDEEVLRFVNDLERRAGTYLLGRRMYETLKFWEGKHALPGLSPDMQDFARIWQSADKIVYSTTLQEPSTARTEIRRDFDPTVVRELKAAAGRDLTVGLVDEYQLFLVPVVVGGGTLALPQNVRLNLELVDEHRFSNGVAYLCYRPA